MTRIEELAAIARDSVNKGVYGVDEWIREDNKAFAKLIVKECGKVVYDNAIERRVRPDINPRPTHYAIAVLDHFGVEE